MSNWSSYKDDKVRTDKWREFLAEAKKVEPEQMDELFGLSNPFKKMRKRGWEAAAAEMDAEDAATPPAPTDPEPEPAAAEPEEPAAPAAPAAEADAGMPISGTEFATMNFLVNGGLLDIIKQAANVGAAAKDPESKNLQQLFNREFFPALVKMTKNPNIDIAEGIDMEEFLQEMLIEADEPLTRRQQSYRKGQKRAQGGMQRYLKPMGGGKPPMIANKISRALTQALTQKADANSLFDAAAEVSHTIKDPKAKAQYEKSYTNQLEKNPDKRVANYKQNVAAFVGSVSDLATKAAAKAIASGGNFAADKASSQAGSRQAQQPAAEPQADVAPQRAASAAAPASARSARGSRAAVARSRMRHSPRGVGIKGVTSEGGVTEALALSENKDKKWKVLADGTIQRIDNEKK